MTIWAAWVVVTRIGVAKTLAMAAGAGAPFFLASSAGMRFAPAAQVGALLPGTMPLFVALLSALLFGERFGRSRLTGFGLILLGVAAIGGGSLVAGTEGEWRGHLLFLVAASLWAGYTLALKRAGIGPWHAAALVNAYSVVGLVPVLLLGPPSRLLAAPPGEVALQTLFQGSSREWWRWRPTARRCGASAPRARRPSAPWCRCSRPCSASRCWAKCRPPRRWGGSRQGSCWRAGRSRRRVPAIGPCGRRLLPFEQAAQIPPGNARARSR